jgi:hypothetical protein
MSQILYELPANVPTSPDLKERALAWIEFRSIGGTYYAPITKEAKKLLGLHTVLGKLVLSYDQINLLEKYVHDIYWALYIEIRDTVGSEIHDSISEDIKKQFHNMFSKKLGDTIEKGLDKRLMPAQLTQAVTGLCATCGRENGLKYCFKGKRSSRGGRTKKKCNWYVAIPLPENM